jgi:hypothetical protein
MLMIGPALAQESTPSPEGTENPRQVSAEECVSEPRSYDDIAAILNLDGDGVPQPDSIQITPPLGEVVDSATDIAIKEVAREVLACFNAGDVRRAAALMTDNGIKRSYWGLTIDEENRALARERLQAAPEARLPELFVRLITVTDASLLPDGRVAAFVVINEPLLPPQGPETLLFIFANQDGQWKVDDYIDFSIIPPDYGAESTPQA